MRRSLLASLVVACGALVFSVGAHAIPIHVGLTGAAGQHEWTSGPFGDPSYLHLSAWQYDQDSGTWIPADMTLVDTTPNADGGQGLGVCGGQLSNDNSSCSPDSNQIDSTPWQVIDIDITDLTDWNSLTATLLSVDPLDSALLLGSSCPIGGTATCAAPTELGSCANASSSGSFNCQLKLFASNLQGITDIWVTPSATNPGDDGQGNILLSADFIVDGTPARLVPEPDGLGIFGLGVLLLLGFAGVRRRRRPH